MRTFRSTDFSGKNQDRAKRGPIRDGSREGASTICLEQIAAGVARQSRRAGCLNEPDTNSPGANRERRRRTRRARSMDGLGTPYPLFLSQRINASTPNLRAGFSYRANRRALTRLTPHDHSVTRRHPHTRDCLNDSRLPLVYPPVAAQHEANLSKRPPSRSREHNAGGRRRPTRPSLRRGQTLLIKSDIRTYICDIRTREPHDLYLSFVIHFSLMTCTGSHPTPGALAETPSGCGQR